MRTREEINNDPEGCKRLWDAIMTFEDDEEIDESSLPPVTEEDHKRIRALFLQKLAEREPNHPWLSMG